MKWFREGPSPFQTPLAMIGAKRGDRVLVLGAADGALAAQVALVTGLNGRTLVVDADPAAAGRVQEAAAKAGALIEVEAAPLTMLPIDAGTFDIAVLNMQLAAAAEGHRALMCGEAHRVLRTGGRIVCLERGPRPGLLGWLPRSAVPALAQDVVLALLERARFRGARVLADSEGTTYYEARV